MKRKDVLSFTALAVNSAALIFAIYWLCYWMVGSAWLFMSVAFGIPILVSGLFLSIRYRKDIRRSPAMLFAALGSGCTFILLAAVPANLYESYLTRTHNSMVATILLFVGIMFCCFLVAPISRWLHRQSLAFLTRRQNAPAPP